MDIIKRIADIANRHPNRVAYELEGKTMTYRELNLYSDRLAVYLLNQSGDKEPLMVYGHKSPLMLVSFLACVKSGRAYCPVDISVPARRVEMIARLLPSKFVLTPEPGAEFPILG